MILFVAMACAMGLTMAILEGLQLAVLGLGLFAGIGLLSLYLVLGAHAMLRRWRLRSPDTSTHVLDWVKG